MVATSQKLVAIICTLLSITSPIAANATNVEVSFEIDENYLIVHTLIKRPGRTTPKPYIIDFKNKVWKNSLAGYKLLKKLPYIRPKDIRLANPLLKPLLKEAKKLPEYQRLLKETEVFRKEMENEWLTDYPVTSKFVRNTTRLPISGKFTLYVTHPSVGNGRYLGDNTIAFGTKAEWTHYYSVYVWHEILHAYMKSDVVSHAVNQVITDNGLRFLLKSDNKDPNFGHLYLFPLMQEIQLKHWPTYLMNKSENILDFVKRIKKDPTIRRLRREAEEKRDN